ncbi:MAG: hypothetical protein ACE5DI_03145 [Candidatus Micrarchaeia archaeon]
MSKLIRLSEKTYQDLSKVAGSLQVRAKKAVSLDEAVAYLCAKHEKRAKGFWKKLKSKKQRKKHLHRREVA